MIKNNSNEEEQKPYDYFHKRIKISPPLSLQKIVEKYFATVKKITDRTPKHFSKFLEFSSNDEFANYIADTLTSLEYPLFENDGYHYFAIVVLALSQNEKSLTYLDFISDYAIQEKDPMIAKIHTITHSIDGAALEGLRQKATSYFNKLYINSDYLKFSDMIGIDIPDQDIENPSSYGFCLSTIEGVNYKWNLEPEQHDLWYLLTVNFYAPNGTEKCFSVQLQTSNSSNNVTLYHWHKQQSISSRTIMELYFDKSKEKFIIENGTDLMSIKNTITQIENLCGIRFIQTFVDSSFSKGIKQKKNLQKWFLEK